MPSLYVIQGSGQGSHFDVAELISSSDKEVIGIGREKGNEIAVEIMKPLAGMPKSENTTTPISSLISIAQMEHS